MNAFVRPAKHTFVAIDEIDLSHTIRPYNAGVVGELAQSIRAIGLQTPLTCIVRDGQHILVAGRNRLEALRLIGAEHAHGANASRPAQGARGDLSREGRNRIDDRAGHGAQRRRRRVDQTVPQILASGSAGNVR
jgi:hypothetical protein